MRFGEARIMNRLMIWALLFTAVPVATDCIAFAGSPPGPIQIKVRNKVLHRIDARLFGQFMERASWGGEIGAEAAVIPGTHQLRPKAKQLLHKMRVPIVRFPGGTDADYIDWCDMIDKVPGRSGGRPLTTGHTGNQVTNNFGYDEILRLCEELEMESSTFWRAD